jgi:hypothetical protein
MKDFDGLTPPRKMKFETASFWVQIHNLPLACMNREVGYKIGSSVGVVEEVDVSVDGVGWGKYLRVKIELNLSKPLARGRTLQIGGRSMWVAFQYEKLPKFCFNCGVIKHGEMGCSKFAVWRRLHEMLLRNNSVPG